MTPAAARERKAYFDTQMKIRQGKIKALQTEVVELRLKKMQIVVTKPAPAKTTKKGK